MEYIHGKSVIHIAITEDHLMVMQALSLLINTSFEKCTVTLKAVSGEELIEKVYPKNLPDLIIMDMELPGIKGLDTIRKLKTIYPGIKFLGVSMHPSEYMARRTLKAGGHGYLEKNFSDQELKTAIYEIMKTGYYFCDKALRGIANDILENKNHAIHNFLTDEQIIFLRLLATGEPYKALAGIMKISPRHIEHLRKILFEHFEVHSRTELTVKAIQMGFAV